MGSINFPRHMRDNTAQMRLLITITTMENKGLANSCLFVYFIVVPTSAFCVLPGKLTVTGNEGQLVS